MHSSLSDELGGVNASATMARLLARLDRERRTVLRFEPHPLLPLGPTLNAGLRTTSGVGYGVLSGRASFQSDVRALPGMTRDDIEADLEAFLERAHDDDPELDATLSVDLWLAACEIAADHPVVQALSAAAAAHLPEAPPLGAFPGGTDAPHMQLVAGIPTVPSFGPGLLTTAHRSERMGLGPGDRRRRRDLRRRRTAIPRRLTSRERRQPRRRAPVDPS